jgi:circadian clock protein KaiC
MRNSPAPRPSIAKSATGIEGLDEILLGGLPTGRTTLLIGGPGSGKTVLALQTLVNGARHQGEPGIFVAFEENSRRIVANAATFGWNLPALERRRLFFLDAQPGPDVVSAGAFDLQGLLASLEAKVRQMGARRIVFDSVDLLLDLLDDPAAARREISRLHEWLLARGLTAILTAKAKEGGARVDAGPYGFVHYMVDCALTLNHGIVAGVSQRSLRVLKFRGSAFSENESPMVIGEAGLEVAGARLLRAVAEVGDGRISTGVARLDTMLAGGYHRGASVLVTGAPGTAKTTLAGAFAQAACDRGERVLFATYDSDPGEIVRNLASVGLRLARGLRAGLLAFHATRSTVSSAEVHLLRIKAAARAHRARCVIVDPLSALANDGNLGTAHSVVERLVDWAKAEGITLLCTSLLARDEPESEATPLQISTIADTWLHLSYVVHAGERNRALTIVKSRGTAHSNQVRELTLTDAGITLTDVYTAGGEVLMGALRWERERAEEAARRKLAAEFRRKRLETRLAEAKLEGRARELRRQLELNRAELETLLEDEAARGLADARDRATLRKLRSADAAGGKRGTRSR